MTDDIISRAKDRFEKSKSAWAEIHDAAREDLRFLSDEKDSQWDQKIAMQRRERGLQVLTLDQSGQFVHQVVNDIRQNTPSINVIPDGEGSDPEVAEAFKGIIRGIEYESNADSAYDMAAVHSVSASIGAIRIDHDYVDDTSDNQKLCIKRVINPLSIFIDPASIEIDGRDAEFCFILDKLKVSEFNKLYPDKNATSFEGANGTKKLSENDEITIAEYFVKDYVDAGQTDGGRKLKKTIIRRYKISGEDILEETTFPGKYIPIVPVYGEEAWIDGKRKLHSLIRKAKPGQYLYNLWRSLEADMILRSQRAPVIAPEGATEAFAADYKDPDKSAVLRYTEYDDQGRQLSRPARLDPAPIPSGIVNAAREMVDDIKASMGMYSASIGARGNETSGIAIQRRQIEGDTATLHFGDNLVKSITQVGRILVSAIPEIYDTPRYVTSIDIEDEPKTIGINGMMAQDQEAPIDLKKGQYSVRVTTGASYTTKRQEAATFFSDIVAKQPQLMQVAGDLLFKNMDFPGAEALSERLKKTIDPVLLEGENGQEAQDPQKMQLVAQLQQQQQVIEQMQQALESKQASEQMSMQLEQAKLQLEQTKLQLDAEKIANDRAKTEIDAQKAQTEQFKAQADAEIRVAELHMQAQAPESAEAPENGDSEEMNMHHMQMGGSMINPENMSEEELMALINKKREEAAKCAAMEAKAEADRQEALAMQQANMQQQAALASAIVDAVNNLSAIVNTPKKVLRDENGKIIGVE